MRPRPTTARLACGGAELGARDGLASYVALQPHYNLMERDDTSASSRRCAPSTALPCCRTSPGAGLPHGKYRRDGAPVESPRAASVQQSYFNERGFAVLDALERLAGEHGTTVAAVALAWLLAQPTVARADRERHARSSSSRRSCPRQRSS